jgi:1,4-dihydroxy-2-naphthoate octaprenyltransferase
MTSEALQQNNPATAEFVGPGFGRAAKRLFNATRPKFLPASVLPVLAGSAWGFSVAGQLDWISFLLALGATVCVHAGANVLNDVGDDEIGTDPRNESRIYPYTGGSRFIQTGIMSRSGMFRLGVGLLVAASLAGVWLILREGTGILWFGLAGLLLAIAYSLGPLRLSGLGLGEAAVGIAFGILPVTGAAWVQSGVVDGQAVLYSLPVAIWVAAILLINEVPDIEADAASGKRTLPVRLGLGGTAILYLSMNGIAAADVIWLTVQGALPLLSPLVPVGLLALAAKSAGAIRRGVADRPDMTRAIEATLGIHTIGSLWLAAAILYVAFVG